MSWRPAARTTPTRDAERPAPRPVTTSAGATRGSAAGRSGAGPSAASQVLALRRVVGNSTVSSLLGGGHTTVQRADAADPPATPRHRFAPEMPPNPALYSDFGGHYFTGGRSPGDGWIKIEQYCAYLATYWLCHGHGPAGLRFDALDHDEQVRAADSVVGWASAGGREAQTAYAREALQGDVVTREALSGSAADLPVGTRIWFGDDHHAEAAYVVEPGVFLMYDPNTGRTTRRKTADFTRYIQRKNVFVRT